MFFTIIILPFIGSLIVGLRGRTIGQIGAGIITTSCIGISILISWVGVYEVVLGRSIITVEIFEWINIYPENIKFYWIFTFDDLTIIICAVVLTISTIVHIYSIDYISQDPHGQRFISLLSLFTAFIIVLVTGNNFAIMFVGWEGIGVSSFLLIGFWYTRVQAVKSAVKAITVNRVGDIFLTIGIFIVIAVYGSLDYSTVFSSVNWIGYTFDAESIMVITTLLILIGAIAKSAQVPLHGWLAAAMEG